MTEISISCKFSERKQKESFASSNTIKVGSPTNFFSEMVYPGYLETLSRDTDTGPLLTFRSQLALFDPVVMFSKVAIMALYRLFSLVEQVVSGMGKDNPGGKSCSIVLDKPIWLFPLSLWLVSHGAVTEPLPRSAKGVYRYQLKFDDSNAWAIFTRTSCIEHLVEWRDDELGAASSVHISLEHPVTFVYKKTHLHVSFSLATKANEKADTEIRSDNGGTKLIIEHLKRLAEMISLFK